MKKFLLLCLNMLFMVPIVAARPVLTKAKWEQMKQPNALQEEIILPEARPILIEDVQDIQEIDQTPPPLPPRPGQAGSMTPPPLPPRPGAQSTKLSPPPLPPRSEQAGLMTPPPLPPRPGAQQPMTGAAVKEQIVQDQSGSAIAKPALPFTGQDFVTQTEKLKKVTPTPNAQEKPLGSFQQQLKAKFKGASGSEDEESETEEWEWED